MQALTKRSWSPYWVGAGIGALETFAFWTAGRPLGITTAFEGVAAMVPGAGREARREAPGIDWETGVVAGVVLGSYLSARLSRERPGRSLSAAWRRRFGRRKKPRYAAAAAGGALMMLGARMAKGCTSGHGISGTMQFAASSWLFTPVLFASGVLVSRALHGRRR